MGAEQLAVPFALALVLLWGLMAVARWLLGALVVFSTLWVTYDEYPQTWIGSVDFYNRYLGPYSW